MTKPTRPEVRARLMKANEDREDSHPINRVNALVHTGEDENRHFYLAVFEADHPDGEALSLLNLRYFALAKEDSTMADTFLRNGINMREPAESSDLPAALEAAFGRVRSQREMGENDFETLFIGIGE